MKTARLFVPVAVMLFLTGLPAVAAHQDLGRDADPVDRRPQCGQHACEVVSLTPHGDHDRQHEVCF